MRSDSPRCLLCLDDGKNGQTYYHLNSRKFKCSSCGRLYAKNNFTQLDMGWRSKFSEWRDSVQSKLSKVGKNRLDSIEGETK